MKVNQNPAPQSQVVDEKKAIVRTQGKIATQKAASTGIEKGIAQREGATIDISDEAKMMSEINKIVHNTPDVRTDKVNSLRKSILDGTYKVDAAKVADRLVESHLAQDFGKNNF